MLDNNDNGPEFSQPSYDVTISEDVLPDTEILQIEATDRDEKHKLSYTVHSSIDAASMRKFRMDPSTGVLYTAERLDHEAQDKHILNVMVRPKCLIALLAGSLTPRGTHLSLQTCKAPQFCKQWETWSLHSRAAFLFAFCFQ